METKELKLVEAIQAYLGSDESKTLGFIAKFEKGAKTPFNQAKSWFGIGTKVRVGESYYTAWESKSKSGQPFRLMVNGRRVIVQKL